MSSRRAPGSRRRRLPIVLAALAAVTALVIAVAVAVAVFLPSFFVQDALYDNVPVKVPCAEVPTRTEVEKSLPEFPDLGDADAIAVDYCAGAVIELQYSDNTTRQEIEEYLKRSGAFDEERGWSWKSIPVALHNV